MCSIVMFLLTLEGNEENTLAYDGLLDTCIGYALSLWVCYITGLSCAYFG